MISWWSVCCFLYTLQKKPIALHNRWRASCPAVPPWVPVLQTNKTEAGIFLTSNHNTFLLFREVEDAGDAIVHEFGWCFGKIRVLESNRMTLSFQRVSGTEIFWWDCVTVVMMHEYLWTSYFRDIFVQFLLLKAVEDCFYFLQLNVGFLHLPLLPIENQRFVKLKVWHLSHKVVINTVLLFYGSQSPH